MLFTEKPGALWSFQATVLPLPLRPGSSWTPPTETTRLALDTGAAPVQAEGLGTFRQGQHRALADETQFVT